MEVRFELLIPGMQDSDKAQGSAQFFPSKLEQGLRDGFEEDIEHHRFILQGDEVQVMGESEHDVEVGGGKEFGLAFFKPSFPGDVLALGAVSIAAGMIEDTLCAAVGAALDVASHGGGAAVEEVGDDSVLIWG
jgi:hypothetical protein